MGVCLICGGDCEESVFQETFEEAGFTITVRGIPGETCLRCGKRCISKSTAESLKMMVDEAIKAARRGHIMKRISLHFKKAF